MTARTGPAPGRNDPCRCGSGRKYKHCCLEKDEKAAAVARAKAAAAVPDQPSDTPAAIPKRAPKHRTDQPWKATSTRGFVPRSRTPRKVGGS
jgi:SEC-C motif